MPGQWHNSMRSAIASMIGRGWSNGMIRMMCKPYYRDDHDDTELDALINDGRAKWGVPNEEQDEPAVPTGNDVARLNEIYAVLPIGGKTRVVKFGELDEFPGRKTIVMTQTLGDFEAFNDKYRHVYLDKKGELQSSPMGTYWIGTRSAASTTAAWRSCRYCDGDVGDKLNLWHGFGVKAVKTNDGLREIPRLRARHHL